MTEEELGLVPSTNAQQSKIRVILIELQRLFAQLLMLDQDSCSTNRLTDSFGWTNNEEMQQHDVQELNRILFDAIEKTLTNTKQSELIQKLYRGTFVNKIKCLTCLSVFQREEEFLDLPITVQGSSSLETSLINSFIMRENMDGNNQYRCEKCNNEYRDAERYCQLKTLPPILTFSLLRFTYDLKTFQRIKETSRFEFPLELDLINYMEDSIKSNLDINSTKYELFSVIIHSGSAYGGHYHCLIKDFDNLGKWKLKENSNNNQNSSHLSAIVAENINSIQQTKEICLICCDDEEFKETSAKTQELVNLDYLKYNEPVDLLKAFIYNKYKYEKVKIDAMCADLFKSSGMSWNKNFKSKYGPIEKYLKKYDDTFDIDLDKKLVNVKQHDRINIVSSQNYSSNYLIESCLKECVNENEEKKEFGAEEKNNQEDDLVKSKDWYDFDDSRISSITTANISKQFEGKESAYMLFYRRKTSINQEKSSYSPFDQVPIWLKNEVTQENTNLNIKRSDFENRENIFKLECLLDSDFYLEQNVLNLKQESEGKSFELSIDKRKHLVNDLNELLLTQCTDTSITTNEDLNKRKEIFLNILLDDSTSYYWLLISRVDTSSSSNAQISSSSGRFSYYCKSLLSDNQANLFDLIKPNENKSYLILSKQKDKFPIGDQYEPIRIIVKFFDANYQITEISFTFTKSTLIKQVKEEISAFYLSQVNDDTLTYDSLTFSLLPNNKNKLSDKIVLQIDSHDFKTLEELKFKNGDFITIESSSKFENTDMEVKSNNNDIESFSMTSEQQSVIRKINIINLIDISTSNQTVSQDFEFDTGETLNNIKIIAMSSFNLKLDQTHLRFVDEEDLNKNQELLNYVSTHSIKSSDELSNDFKLSKLIGQCLYDDITLNELIQSNKILSENIMLVLCEGKAPLKSKNDIVLNCLIDEILTDNQANQAVEVIVNLKEATIYELTQLIHEKACLKPIEKGDDETYFLKTLDWLGDADTVLNDMNQTLQDANLKHNQSLLITKGKLIPPNHYKVRCYISTADYALFEKMSLDDKEDLLVLNDFIDEKYSQFKFLEELIVSNDIKLEDFVMLIQNLLIDRADVTNCEHIRLRLLKKFGDEKGKYQMKKRLFDMNKMLKQLGFQQETSLCVQILNNEDEYLNQGIILLDCIQFDLEKKLCKKSTYRQIYWNINNGATLSSLRDSILKSYSDLLEPSDIYKMHIAKRLHHKSSWIILKELNQTQNDSTKLTSIKEDNINCNNNIGGGKQKKKKNQKTDSSSMVSKTGLQQKTNLRQGPFNLDDGDLIAFVLITDSSMANKITYNDFMSQIDLDLVKKDNLTKAELARLKKERNISNNTERKSTSYRRPEVGITIKIDDDFN